MSSFKATNALLATLVLLAGVLSPGSCSPAGEYGGGAADPGPGVPPPSIPDARPVDDKNKTDSEKLLPFVGLDAEQGLSRGDGSFGPPEHEHKSAQQYAGSATTKECQYDNPEFSDCDPFTLKKTRVKNLIRGGASCGPAHVNETEDCSQEDFPEGTRYLLKEHKKCISELEHLKGLLSELHRYVDLIVERGVALRGAFEDLRKHADEIQRHIKDLHKEVFDNTELAKRLVKELDEWKAKARTLRGELDTLKAKYAQLKKEHERMEIELKSCNSKLNACNSQKADLVKQVDSFEVQNRDLKTQLMEAEKYKLETEKAQANLNSFKEEVLGIEKEISLAKEERAQCRMDLGKDEGVDRDTNVHLDMKMFITHNQTLETTTPANVQGTPFPPQKLASSPKLPYGPPSTYAPPAPYPASTMKTDVHTETQPPYPPTTTTYKTTTTEYVPPPTYTTTTEYSTPSTEKYPEPTTTKQEYKY